MMEYQTYIAAFVTLFVIIDPVGLAPLFASLTSGLSTKARTHIALRALVIAFGLLTLFGLIGDQLLDFMGISMPAFRIAGGLLLFLTALEMLFERRSKRREQHAEASDDHAADDPSVYPLAMPLLAGPGAITTMILLVDQTESIKGVLMVEAILLSVLAVALVLFSLTSVLERILGATGINVVTRIMGMLLAALSVQFVIDGIRASLF